MINWKLEADLLALLDEKEKAIWITSSDKKYHNWLNKIEKLFSDSVIRKNLAVTNFRLSIDKNSNVFIESSELSGKYCVKNFDDSTIFSILSQASHIEDGLIKDNTYEVITNDNSYLISFTNDDCENFNICMSNMVKSVSIASSNKTTKWVVGNRYDDKKNTYIYLGEVYSLRKSAQDRFSINESQKAHLVLDAENGNCTFEKVSEVFNNVGFGDGDNCIKVIYEKIPLMYNSGKVLEDDVTGKLEFESFWGNLIDNSNKLKFKLLPLDFYSSNHDNFSAQDLIKDKIVDSLYNCALIAYIAYEDITDRLVKPLISSDTLEKRIEALRDILWSEVDHYNLSPVGDYYESLFKHFNMDLRETIFKKVLSNSVSSLVFGSIDKYLNNAKYYFKYRNLEKIYRQRFLSINRNSSYIDARRIGSILKDYSYYPTLLNTILEIIDCVKDTDNVGNTVSTYSLLSTRVNGQTVCYLIMEITAEEILNFVSNQNREEIEKEILQSKFWKMYIELDKDGDVE